MYLAAFRVALKILVLLQPLFEALFLLFNIISEIDKRPARNQYQVLFRASKYNLLS